MRVLHIGKYYPPYAGGMEYFLFDLLGALAAHGVRAGALVHHEQVGLRGKRPSPRAQTPIYRAPCLGRLIYVPISPTFPAWLNRSIREFAPDILHLHLPNSSALSVLMSSRALGLPIVLHWHADLVASKIDRRLALAYRIYRPFEQRLLAASAAVIVTSPAYLEASEALAPWRGRCVTIPLGIDPGRLSEPTGDAIAHAAPHWGDAELRVLAVGRLTYYKGHDVLIRAATQLSSTKVVIVGAGEEHARLAALIASLGLQGRVSLLGFRSPSELNALLASCDALCLPSLERTEAFGLVLLEAMRFSKPLVVSDIAGSGATWVVRQTGNGVTFPAGDASALAAALRSLRHDPDRRRRLGLLGAQAIDHEFGIGSVAGAVALLYRTLLKRGSAKLPAGETIAPDDCLG